MTIVVNRRTGDQTDLAQLLVELQERPLTGTLKLTTPDGQVKFIYLRRGTIELLNVSHSCTLLGKALLKRGKLTDEQLRAAQRKAASTRLRLGAAVVAMDMVQEEDVLQAHAYVVVEQILELFGLARLESEFFRGDPPLDIFEAEDLQARVSLSPSQLAREAARRQKELDELRRVLPSSRDVYAPTSQAGSRVNEQSPELREVLAHLDGRNSLDEVLDVVRAPDIVAMRVIARMVREHEARALTGEELFSLGQELEDRGENERAWRRYLRAEELGATDFDLPRRIGQMAECLGEKAEACQRYVEYAVRCSENGHPEVAAATLMRVLELDPEHREAQELRAHFLGGAPRERITHSDSEASARVSTQDSAPGRRGPISSPDHGPTIGPLATGAIEDRLNTAVTGGASIGGEATGAASVAHVAANLGKGTVIDRRYRLERELGRGGMGAVWVAHDVKFGKERAVKIAGATGAAYDTFRARFKREAHLGELLSAQGGIVRALDWGELPDGMRLYLVMDLVDGARPLDLSTGRLDERLHRFERACACVAGIHARGVVHRDLKPENFLQAPDGAIWLTDFGLGKRLYEAGDLASEDGPDLTATGEAWGTPSYMPPEQFEDFAGVDARADVFALGVMLFQLLTGDLPYPGRKGHEIQRSHMRVEMGKVPAPRPTHGPGMDALGAACGAALSLDRATRPADATAFLQRLREARAIS